MRQYGNQLTIETDHYRIYSTATRAQTLRVAERMEILHAAYTTFFGGMLSVQGREAKLKVKLYKDRREFKQLNKDISWEEAFYREPYCHAYYPARKPNPYHWMVHEGTHQLNNEAAHFKIAMWIDEGLAAYFGTSTIKDGKMMLGQSDADTYPIWWLPRMSLAANIEQDLKEGNIIPLRSVITGRGGPNINEEVNLYYIHYWSLTHFLFHYNNGVYSAGFRHVIDEGGSLESFEKRIGPLDRIQAEWYGHLQRQVSEAKKRKLED